MTRLEAQQRAKMRRKALAQLSLHIKPLVAAGRFQSVNDGLLHMYREQTGQQVFHTFHGWKERGCSINKGETGYPIWSKPQVMQDDAEDEETIDESKARRVYRMAYLFHYGQVTDHSKALVAASAD